LPSEADRPQEPMPVKYTQALPSCTWGLEKWGQMFSDRQLLAMQTFVEELHEIKAQLGPTLSDYDEAMMTYLAILLNRIIVNSTSYGRWDVTTESLKHPFARQAKPMVFDYPESNPF